MAKMTTAQREAFLADLHVGVVSIDDPDPGRAPLSVPIWYSYTPASGVSIVTSPESRKGRALAAAGRFTLVAQLEHPPQSYMYVSVEGPVVEVRPCDLEGDLRPLAVRYLGEQLGNSYAEAWHADDEQATVYTMRPERWFTFDFTGELPD
jgi:uncharacterized protein